MTPDWNRSTPNFTLTLSRTKIENSISQPRIGKPKNPKPKKIQTPKIPNKQSENIFQKMKIVENLSQNPKNISQKKKNLAKNQQTTQTRPSLDHMRDILGSVAVVPIRGCLLATAHRMSALSS